MNVTNVTCHNSTITGDIDTDAIKDVLNYALKLTLPTLNQEFLEKGYPLP